VTDLGGNLAKSLQFSSSAEMAFGTSVPGASKVFTLSTCGAVFFGAWFHFHFLDVATRALCGYLG